MSPIDRQQMIASGNLISVSQAAKLTPYTGEYLSLLARKGKLKAFKISRDWITSRDVVLEYVKKQELKHKKLAQEFQHAGRMVAP